MLDGRVEERIRQADADFECATSEDGFFLGQVSVVSSILIK
jgi:hypothetical protein